MRRTAKAFLITDQVLTMSQKAVYSASATLFIWLS